MAEIEAEAVNLRAKRFRRDFAPVLIDDRPARLRAAKRRAGERLRERAVSGE